MKTKNFFLSTFLLMSFSLINIQFIDAQTKKLSLEDAVMAYQKGLYPKSLNGVQWKTNAEEFSHVKDYKEFKVYNAKTKKEQTVFTLDDLNKALKNKSLDALRYIPFWAYGWVNNEQIYMNNENNFVFFDVSKKEISRTITLPKEAENIIPNPDYTKIAYTIENNLFVANSNGDVFQVTDDKDKGIVNGNGYTHRQEFGITKGSFWSPDGKKLAYYRKDETMVTDFPIIDIEARVAKDNPIKYPMAGMKSEEVKLMVFDTDKKQSTEMKTGEPKEQYLTNIVWTPDNSSVMIAIVNREQNYMKLNVYDANGGDLKKTLFEEKNSRYVEPENPAAFVPGSTDLFVWQSERDGYNHLYLYDLNGKMKQQLTRGEYVVTQFNGFSSDGKTAFYTANTEKDLDRDVYRVALKNGKSKRLTSESGVHSASFSHSGNFFTDDFSSKDIPGIFSLVSNKGVATQIYVAENPVKDYNIGSITVGSLKAADEKTDLYYRLITPPNFDPNKKYPTIVYVYGGPHAQMVENSWMAAVRFWQVYMAQEGYVMFTLDNRGSANRGFEFESVIHRQLGQEEMKDQMKGIEFLKSLPYVDADRLGVHGWSFGGFMTVSQMLTYPDVYKVGVAGGPVIDWKYYEIMYGERYMDMPQENPEGYAKTSLLDKVDKLNGKLLLIHGGIDPVVVKQHSDLFIRRSVQAGVYPDYFPYPTHEHNVRGKDRVHLMQYITNYFEVNLKKEK